MKKPSAKGKGADIFLGDEAAKPRRTTQATVAKGKGSFYLPIALLEQLDQTWMQLRIKNRKLTKSEFVQAAIEEMIQEYQQQQENSRLYQRLIDHTEIG